MIQIQDVKPGEFSNPLPDHVLYMMEDPVGENLKWKQWKKVKPPWKAWFLTFRTAKRGVVFQIPAGMVSEIRGDYVLIRPKNVSGMPTEAGLKVVRYNNIVVWQSKRAMIVSIAKDKVLNQTTVQF